MKINIKDFKKKNSTICVMPHDWVSGNSHMAQLFLWKKVNFRLKYNRNCFYMNLNS